MKRKFLYPLAFLSVAALFASMTVTSTPLIADADEGADGEVIPLDQQLNTEMNQQTADNIEQENSEMQQDITKDLGDEKSQNPTQGTLQDQLYGEAHQQTEANLEQEEEMSDEEVTEDLNGPASTQHSQEEDTLQSHVDEQEGQESEQDLSQEEQESDEEITEEMDPNSGRIVSFQTLDMNEIHVSLESFPKQEEVDASFSFK